MDDEQKIYLMNKQPLYHAVNELPTVRVRTVCYVRIWIWYFICTKIRPETIMATDYSVIHRYIVANAGVKVVAAMIEKCVAEIQSVFHQPHRQLCTR